MFWRVPRLCTSSGWQQENESNLQIICRQGNRISNHRCQDARRWVKGGKRIQRRPGVRLGIARFVYAICKYSLKHIVDSHSPANLKPQRLGRNPRLRWITYSSQCPPFCPHLLSCEDSESQTDAQSPTVVELEISIFEASFPSVGTFSYSSSTSLLRQRFIYVLSKRALAVVHRCLVGLWRVGLLLRHLSEEEI